MIPLQVKSISLSNVGFVVMLVTQDGARSLPIFIGVPEAQAIALQVNRIKPPRPMTHDLLKGLLDLFESKLQCVVITDLQEGTFFARLEIAYENRILEVDSRPSDAIALALRCSVPIFAEEAVMEAAAIATEDLAEGGDQAGAQGAGGRAGRASGPQDEMQALKNRLQEAIRDERYEEAARLRDEIKHRESTN